ncbi:MAG: cell division protein FtsQ/DivIB [Dongiaceae bacterium]
MRSTRVVGVPAMSPRRRPWSWERTIVVAGMSTVVALTVLIGATTWLAQNGWIERQAAAMQAGIIDLSSEWGFNVRRVLADGRNETTSGQILRAIDVRIGQPILSVDLVAARERIEALPWIEHATIERRLPDTLYVRLQESEPLALWQKKQQFFLISRTGKVIEEPRIARFANLLVIVGADAPEHASELLELLDQQPELSRHVVAAVRVAGRRWNLRLANGIDIKLPELDSAAAWRELARLDRERGILARDLSVIDLRVPDRLVVRLSPTAIERNADPGDDT